MSAGAWWCEDWAFLEDSLFFEEFAKTRWGFGEADLGF